MANQGNSNPGNFANDREKASEAGRSGGQSQGKENNPGNFANDREKASEAGTGIRNGLSAAAGFAKNTVNEAAGGISSGLGKAGDFLGSAGSDVATGIKNSVGKASSWASAPPARSSSSGARSAWPRPRSSRRWAARGSRRPAARTSASASAGHRYVRLCARSYSLGYCKPDKAMAPMSSQPTRP